MKPTSRRSLVIAALTAPLWAQSVELISVVSKAVSRTVDLPAEIQPYLSVAVHARVAGYVEHVMVDRGSVVKQGQLLADLSAPELAAHIAEAESRVQTAESEGAQAEAQLAAAQSTYDRLREASATPGAVAGNEVVQAQKQVEAAQAMVHAREQARQTAASALRAQKDFEAYLRITAPFDGVVTDRFVHPGALVGPGQDAALLVIQQISKLRVVVAVPEEDVGGIVSGAKILFHVPAHPDRAYTGTVARIAHMLDPKTRTMPVELDVRNPDGSLVPGMYPTVKWPVRREHPALFVPKTSVVSTSERTFVICARDGRAQWVDVKKGATEGDLVEVSGSLAAGDRVVLRGTDELREGTLLKAK